jgi:L-ascorbate metabolism protein UlaG (beta-lactamase superfamily)
MMLERIHWLGHDSFRLDGPPTVYIDPWQLSAAAPPADLILVTHEHYDHCSPEDVARISTPGTVVIAPPSAAKKLGGETQVLRRGERTTVAGVQVEAVPAYNVSKRFHPKGADGVGYIVTIGGKRIYHTGDTDPVPEMEGLEVDILLLPVSGTYVADAEEAAEIVRLVNPTTAIPMHFGTIVGSLDDAERFRKLVTCQVEILTPEE